MNQSYRPPISRHLHVGIFLAMGAFAVVCGTARPLFAQQPASPPASRISSPEVAADRRVTFRLHAPKASNVSLSGEFQRGSTPFTRDDQGVWSVTVGPIEPEIYHYAFNVDGLSIIDPGNPAVKTGSTSRTIQSILEVHGDAPAFYDGQAVPHGEIRTHWYDSKSLGGLRRFTVYIPPGYDLSEHARTRYPVLYLFHGANADETAWTRLGRVNLILDNLIAAGNTKPFIVVMPFGYGAPPGTAAAAGQNTALFGKDLLADVLPFVDHHYRTQADRDHRAIVGLSMGGGQSLNLGLNHLEVFSYVGGFSPALGAATDFPATYRSLLADAETANRRLRLLWVGCGKEDSLFAQSKNFSDFLTQAKIKHTFRETTGAHTWIVWRRYLQEVSPLLFR